MITTREERLVLPLSIILMLAMVLSGLVGVRATLQHALNGPQTRWGADRPLEYELSLPPQAVRRTTEPPNSPAQTSTPAIVFASTVSGAVPAPTGETETIELTAPIVEVSEGARSKKLKSAKPERLTLAVKADRAGAKGRRGVKTARAAGSRPGGQGEAVATRSAGRR